MLKGNTTPQNMQILFKTSLKRVSKRELLVEVFLWLTDARGNENVNHHIPNKNDIKQITL